MSAQVGKRAGCGGVAFASGRGVVFTDDAVEYLGERYTIVVESVKRNQFIFKVARRIEAQVEEWRVVRHSGTHHHTDQGNCIRRARKAARADALLCQQRSAAR
jgi:hypothetical protein